MDGFIILDKPEGMTSAQCVYKLRSILGIKRIGHCGTLDPLATGLLPVCVGEATKFSNYATNHNKVYEVGIKFGIETNTGDITGQTISEKKYLVEDRDLEEYLTNFEGVHYQTPPMFSAIKQDGNPLYYWARKGVYLYREPRRIEIMNIELIDSLKNQATIKVSCSKGTYIRTLIEQLGRGLGSVATVASLRRLEVGHIRIHDNFCKLEEPKESLINKILPCDAMLEGFEKIALNSEDVKKVRNGLSIDYNAPLKNKGLVRIYSKRNLFIGLGQVYKNNKIKPKRLLATN